MKRGRKPNPLQEQKKRAIVAMRLSGKTCAEVGKSFADARAFFEPLGVEVEIEG